MCVSVCVCECVCFVCVGGCVRARVCVCVRVCIEKLNLKVEVDPCLPCVKFTHTAFNTAHCLLLLLFLHNYFVTICACSAAGSR